MFVELSIAEQKLAAYIGTARHLRSREAGVLNMKVSDIPDDKIDREGAAAEIAFCKAMNIYPDLDVGERKAADCTLPSGHTVDVKSTWRQNGMLLAVPWKKQEVDMFALVIGEMPRYRIAGWMFSEELLKPDRLRSVGSRKAYCATQTELFKIEELMDFNGSLPKEEIWKRLSLTNRTSAGIRSSMHSGDTKTQPQ
jgi:hypothetical protein